jgi:hypothetical protein
MVSGNWTVHFSWGCTSNYSTFNITFNAGGTFSGTFNGKWVQQDGTLLLSFDSGPAKYGGTVDGNAGSGAMSTFSGTNGCWYMLKQGTVGLTAEAAEKQKYDGAGAKAKA